MSNHFDSFQMPNHTNDNTFSFNSSTNNSFNNSNHSNSSDVVTNGIANNSGILVKETGIIEKMLISYGFIQCCERQARLFFHFSQFIGNTNHLKIGDPVEYEMSYDKRTGEPVAINIRKITSSDFMTKMLTTERVSGVIATEVQNGGREGRVAFENMGEFFFLPFTQSDVASNVVLKAQDNVSFIIFADDSGNYRAKDIEIEQSSIQSKGIVGSIKETFGFIESDDNSTVTNNKIFFHSSDCKNFRQLEIGDHVEFMVTTRKNQELATSVVKTSNIAEQVTDALYSGSILKYNGRSNPGSGVLKCLDQDQDYIFYDKDVSGTFTLSEMDNVTFQFIIDQQSKTMRPTNIQLNLNTIKDNGEERHRGYIASLKDIYGFIKCPSKEGMLIYFKLSEFITDADIVPKLNDEVEFTFVSDEQSKKCQAIRIIYIPNGTLFNMLNKKPAHETEKSFSEIVSAQNELFSTNSTAGMNGFDSPKMNGNFWSHNGIDSLSYNLKNMDVVDSKATANGQTDTKFSNGRHKTSTLTGVIVSIKDSYGFIESINGENDYFYHNSSYLDGTAELGQTVEFTPELVKGRWKANNVRCKPNISIYENVDGGEEQHFGIVMRTVQMFNADQIEYTGYISPITDIDAQDVGAAVNFDKKYEFSLVSLKFLNDFISIGDCVNYRTARNPITKKIRAYQIEVVRPKLKGTINVLNRYYGFVKPDSSDVKNVYFPKNEFAGFNKLKLGDVIEFYLVDNKNTNKMYAIDIKLISSSNGKNDQQPQESPFKNFMREPREQPSGPRVVIIRQPRAPDGTNGFNNNRSIV